MKNSSNHDATSILLVIWHFFFYSFPGDICRVCRCEGASDRPLFHPCICTGSIKFIHQDCLLQWLKYSKKEFCELCSHRFSFTPIYSPDMPKRLPLSIIFRYLCFNTVTIWQKISKLLICLKVKKLLVSPPSVAQKFHIFEAKRI